MKLFILLALGVVCFAESEIEDSSVAKACDGVTCTDGGWSEWTRRVRRCSVQCGTGSQLVIERRQCNNPPPSNGGKKCKGIRVRRYTRSCTRNKCPVDGGWSDWSEWEDTSDCDALCAGGEKSQTRDRSCTNPPPKFGGNDCDGPATDDRVTECNTFSCDDLCLDGTGYIPHRNPGLFWQCSNGAAYKFYCPSGTVWNQGSFRCDYPEEEPAKAQ
ncbi:hypothetical protein SNE40_004333 [Patella caerulea]|uniref:Chitin-binding type-2 domain-containing protein n=1 Tax=Patella caerulea TaxID=87958 RepID=A0AAN8KBI6_PATCE